MRAFLVASLAAIACGLTTGPAAAAINFATPEAVRGAAIKDVQRRLERAPLPPGAHRLKQAPPNSHMKGPALAVASKNFLDRGRIWSIPLSMDAALSWIHSHPPPGGHSKIFTGLTINGVFVRHDIGFEWKPIPERVNSRLLFDSVATAPDGRTLLRIDAQAVWVLPHPPSEVIPPATTLEVLRKPEAAEGAEEGSPGGGRQTRQVVTDPAAIAGLAARIDRLLPLQPADFEECGPGLPEGLTVVTLIFRDATGAVVAEAVQDVPEGWCSAMKVTIEGVEEPLLVGGGAMLEKQLPLLSHHA